MFPSKLKSTVIKQVRFSPSLEEFVLTEFEPRFFSIADVLNVCLKMSTYQMTQLQTVDGDSYSISIVTISINAHIYFKSRVCNLHVLHGYISKICKK